MNFDRVSGFDWDAGNARKNEAHGVEQQGTEQVFFNVPLIVEDPMGRAEPRYHALGQTDAQRALHITFTLRDAGKLIRVISARPMSRKERVIYEQYKNSEIQE
ncbi:MAG: BrnT family toxin [Rudaea sp.]